MWAECVEQFTGYTGGMLHILTYNRHRGEIGLGAYVVERTRRKFGGKLFTQYADRMVGIGITHRKGCGMLTRRLTNQEHRYAVLGKSREYTCIHTDHPHHTKTLDRNKAIKGISSINDTCLITVESLSMLFQDIV